MNNNDKKEFLNICLGLAENFSVNLSKEGVSMRFEALKDFDISQVRSAAMSLLAKRKYTTMPTVADFYEHISGTDDDKAELQACALQAAIKNVGSCPVPKFKDPVTHDIVHNHIGWRNIVCVDMKNIPFIVKDFKEMYKSYSKAESFMIEAPEEIKDIFVGKDNGNPVAPGTAQPNNTANKQLKKIGSTF